MSEENEMSQEDIEQEKLAKKEELLALKRTADSLGISYSPNIGAAKLSGRIEQRQEEMAKEANKPQVLEKTSPQVAKEEDNKRLPINQKLRKEASRLHRVIVTCLDPMYKDYPSKMFQVGNRVVGTFKKTIPFGIEFHVPEILLKQIEAETFVKHTKVNDRSNDGVGSMKRSTVPRYGIKYLDPLTDEELEGLKASIKAQG